MNGRAPTPVHTRPNVPAVAHRTDTAPGEEWRAIPGFPDYEVSNLGRVVSLMRKKPRLLRGHIHGDGYARVGLMVGPGKQRKFMVHGLVLLAFVGPCPEGLLVRHRDGDPTNNTLSNITYGTPRENNLDKVRHGTDHNAIKTHCPQRHRYDEVNTYRDSRRGSRKCKQCTRARTREYRTRDALRAAGIEVAA